MDEPKRTDPSGAGRANRSIARGTFDWSETPAVEAIVEVLGDGQPTDGGLTPPLYDAVDVEALDVLVRGTADGNSPNETVVSFVYQGKLVTVRGDGVVSVAEA